MAEHGRRDVHRRAWRFAPRSRREAAADDEQERVLLVRPEAAVLAAADVGLVGQGIGDGMAQAGHAVGVGRIGLARRQGDGERRVRAVADLGQGGTGEDLADPVLPLEEAHDGAAARPCRVRKIDGGAHAVGGDDHVGRSVAILQPGVDKQGLQGNDPVHGLMAVIGRHQEQHIVAVRLQPGDRARHRGRVGVGRGEGRQMLGRPQGPGMLGVVRLALPQHREGGAAAEGVVAEAPGHRRIAGGVMGDVQVLVPGQTFEAGSERALPVTDDAVSVRVLEMGGAGRHVGKNDGAAVVPQAFRQGRDE